MQANTSVYPRSFARCSLIVQRLDVEEERIQTCTAENAASPSRAYAKGSLHCSFVPRKSCPNMFSILQESYASRERAVTKAGVLGFFSAWKILVTFGSSVNHRWFLLSDSRVRARKFCNSSGIPAKL